MVALSVVGIAWLVVQSPFLAVTQVKVRGTDNARDAEVLRAAAVRNGAALLFVDTGAVARRVEAAPVGRDGHGEPRAAERPRDHRGRAGPPVAWVRRPVPRGLAQRARVGAVALVDRFGRVLGDETAPAPGLPEIVGVDAGVPTAAARSRRPRRRGALALLPDPAARPDRRR